jgi:hypothetical protein
VNGLEEIFQKVHKVFKLTTIDTMNLENEDDSLTCAGGNDWISLSFDWFAESTAPPTPCLPIENTKVINDTALHNIKVKPQLLSSQKITTKTIADA